MTWGSRGGGRWVNHVGLFKPVSWGAVWIITLHKKTGSQKFEGFQDGQGWVPNQNHSRVRMWYKSVEHIWQLPVLRYHIIRVN